MWVAIEIWPFEYIPNFSCFLYKHYYGVMSFPPCKNIAWIRLWKRQFNVKMLFSCYDTPKNIFPLLILKLTWNSKQRECVFSDFWTYLMHFFGAILAIIGGSILVSAFNCGYIKIGIQYYRWFLTLRRYRYRQIIFPINLPHKNLKSLISLKLYFLIIL